MSPSQFFGDSIFWIEVEKIKPNPFQPRREFDEARLKDLAESIRMYGILQPLTVTRKEYEKPDGGLGVEYELIAGERRLRASKIAGLQQVPVLIRSGEQDDRVKLELAIIENLQREDINSVDRARAFKRLNDEFGMKHIQIAEKVGKSREYVSNTMRILDLPEEILNALSEGKISEGHTRPLLMLSDRKEEQNVLFKDIIIRKITVREAEAFARNIAKDRVRKKSLIDPALAELERKFKETLGTKVYIERKENGGRISIDFFDDADIQALLERLLKGEAVVASAVPAQISEATPLEVTEAPIDDRAPAEVAEEENNEDLYSMKNFGV
ncbi:MAG: ParB/RepB/Spo0J family partition protein [Candidatus Taylorbacteria bacterium]|nr:ParB/RepB/Spo0J family partition protein [Candidatus Taylorbacteria bacterium]